MSLLLLPLFCASCDPTSSANGPNAEEFKVRSMMVEASGVEFEVETDPGDRIGVAPKRSVFHVPAFEGKLSEVSEVIRRDTQQSMSSKTVTSSVARIAFGASMTVIDSLFLSTGYENNYRVSSGTFGNSSEGESIHIKHVTLQAVNDSTLEAVVALPIAAGVISHWGWAEYHFTVASNHGSDGAQVSKRIISEKPDAFLRIRILKQR